MQYRKLGENEVSRFGLGTKRMPITDVSRVDRLDREIAHEITDAAVEAGMNFIDTSYSNHKGEAEDFLGDYRTEEEAPKVFIASNYYEMVDPRFEYVFHKQLKKLKTDCIDYYTLEGVTDLMRMRDIESGAVDFLFKMRDEGKIACLGFSSELSAKNIPDYISRYPWDYVRMQVNFCDWFNKGGDERYQAVKEAGLPIVSHGSLRTGTSSSLKPGALQVLKEANPERSSIDWALRFVKSLDNIVTTTCNMHSAREVKENSEIFNDDVILTKDEFDVLSACAKAQQVVVRH